MVLTDQAHGRWAAAIPRQVYVLAGWKPGTETMCFVAVGRGRGSGDAALQELCFEYFDLCSGCTWLECLQAVWGFSCPPRTSLHSCLFPLWFLSPHIRVKCEKAE